MEIFRARGDCFKELPGEVLGMLSCKEQLGEKKANKNNGKERVVVTGKGIL